MIVSAALLVLAASSAGAVAPLDAECSMRAVDVSGDGEFVVVGWGSNVSFFEKAKDTPLWTYETPGLVDVVLLSDDGQKLAVAYNDGPWPYELGSQGHIAFFGNTSSPVPSWEFTTDHPIRGIGRPSMDMSRDGSMIVAGTNLIPMHVGTIYRFDTASPVPVQTYSYTDSVLSISISGNKEWFAAGTYWHTMRVYNVATGTYCSRGIGDPFYAVAMDYDGTYVAAGHGFASRVDLYGVTSSGTCPLIWSDPTASTNASIAMDDPGTYFVVGKYENPWSEVNGVRLYSTSGPPAIWDHETPEGIYTVDIARDAGLMVCGGATGDVEIMGQASGDPGFTQFIGETVSEVAMSADGSYAAGVSRAGFLYMFETSDGETLVDGIWKTPCDTTLCHVPPGNPGNAHTIIVGGQAAIAHLTNHEGDHLGMCEGQGSRQAFEEESEARRSEGGLSELQPGAQAATGGSLTAPANPVLQRKPRSRPVRGDE